MGKSADHDLDVHEKLTTDTENPFGGDNGVSKSPRAEAKDRTRYLLAIRLFIVINILLVSLVAITTYYVFSDRKIVLLRDFNICVLCADLKLHPDDDIEGVTRVGEDKATCCMKEFEQPNALIGYFADHWLKTKLSNDDRQFTRYECKDSNGRATVRPTIKVVGRNVIQSADHHTLLWDGDSDASIVLPDNFITHHKKHGVLEIKRSGLYYVYSQVVLDHDMNSHNSHKGLSIYQHMVIQHKAGTVHGGSNQRENAIMKTSNSHCSSKSNRQQTTSYLGSAFQLSEGDRLTVKVHNVTEVVPIPHMNFFGAHML